MVNEIWRILAVVIALIARALRRVWRGLRFLVRQAALTRASVAATVPGGGRLLDVAALSFAADLLIVAQWWRRSAAPAGAAAIAGMAVGILLSGLVVATLRGRPAIKFVLAGVEAGRMGFVGIMAFASQVIVVGGASDSTLTGVAVAGISALALVERSLWALALRMIAPSGRRRVVVAGAFRYIGSLLMPSALAALLALAFGGTWALLAAQFALLAAATLALSLVRGLHDAPSPRTPSPRTPSPQAPSPREAAPTESADGTYHIYRPNTMDPPGGKP